MFLPLAPPIPSTIPFSQSLSAPKLALASSQASIIFSGLLPPYPMAAYVVGTNYSIIKNAAVNGDALEFAYVPQTIRLSTELITANPLTLPGWDWRC